MDTTKTGGPAFPTGLKATRTEMAGGKYEGTHVAEFAAAAAGMTLRDYFAAKALAGMLAEPLSDDIDPSSIFFTPNFDKENAQPGDRIAAAAYVLADAMLRARGEA
ncbi:hypothetical protein SY91_02154 [Burkholderia cenocepacia]|uniref:hypothetical protein n=1 Tax=Burkholderia cenocepacia TaxID=95486 RepID=UPI0003C4C9DD|nr:hypothetical protein [Burkholderia cenocepacia]ESS41333.1 hypothetical protein P355_5094 [Burkholderia cenocepacia KC-01]QND94744.1 hypothetical protein SY91_02154 [Burkholderia cenocepacia]